MNLPSSFSFKECLWFLNRNFDDCMHTVGEDYVRKVLLVENKPVLFEIRENQKKLVVKVLEGEEGKENLIDPVKGNFIHPVTESFIHPVTENLIHSAIENFIHDWFDINRDIKPFYEILSAHKELSYMSKDFEGLRLIGIPDLFEAICWCIIGQQINLTFAYKTKRRLVERYGTKLVYEGQDYYAFPSPEILADANPEELKSMQFSTQKVNYLIGIANVFKQGKMSKEILLNLPDISAQQKALTDIKGIGIWTANYTLMKTLRIPSSIPYGDAGLLNGLIAHRIISDKKDITSINEFFQHFKGWESYLVFYLWRSLAPKI